MSKHIDERDMLLFHEPYDESKYCGGTRHFAGLNVEKAKQLVDLGFLDEEEYFNSAPSAGEFIELMEAYPCITAHGYAFSPKRSNMCEVTIEGVESSDKLDERGVEAFVGLCRFADEFNLNPPYAWYD